MGEGLAKIWVVLLFFFYFTIKATWMDQPFRRSKVANKAEKE